MFSIMKETGYVKQNSVRANAEFWIWSWSPWMKYGVGVSSKVCLKAWDEMTYFILWSSDSNQNKERLPKGGDLDFSWELRSIYMGLSISPSSQFALVSSRKSFFLLFVYLFLFLCCFFFFNKKKKNSQSSNVLNMDSLILQREFSLVKWCLHFILLAMPEWNICAGSGMRGGKHQQLLVGW